MKKHDLVIIGSGPAGMAAAINASSEGLDTLVIESNTELGGQARKSTRIENYPGFPDGISGEHLTQQCVAQMKKFGTHVLAPASVVSMSSTDTGTKILTLEDGEKIYAHSVIIAVGLSYKVLDAEDISYFIGNGVYYGCPSSEYSVKSKRNVFVVGGANSAGQAALHLAKNSSTTVNLIIRSKAIEDGMSQYLVDRIKDCPNIKVCTNCTIQSVAGTTKLESAKVKVVDTLVDYDINAIYIFIGAMPKTRFLDDCVERDKKGFICTGRNIKQKFKGRIPYALETSMEGVFSIGDVRADSRKRVGAAVGEGSSVIADIHSYLAL